MAVGTLRHILMTFWNHYMTTQCIFVNSQWHLASCKCFLENRGAVCVCLRAHTHTHSSSLFLNGPCFLCPHRKSNWIADRMKKLIKPRGGGREGRALFTAAGSVENLADSTEFTSDAHTPQSGETTHTTPHNTLPLFMTRANTRRLVFTKICSHAHPIKRGCRHAYKSSHDYQVWLALMLLSAP